MASAAALSLAPGNAGWTMPRLGDGVSTAHQVSGAGIVSRRSSGAAYCALVLPVLTRGRWRNRILFSLHGFRSNTSSTMNPSETIFVVSSG